MYNKLVFHYTRPEVLDGTNTPAKFISCEENEVLSIKLLVVKLDIHGSFRYLFSYRGV